MQDAIRRAKPRKAPGPDKIRPEMFQVDSLRFTEATVTLWETVGRTGYMPTLLRSGLLAPIPKTACPKGPADYRPTVLLSAFRRVISSALAFPIRKHYIVHPNQWGFLPWSNTEIPVAHVANIVSINASCAAISDLKQAYERLSRATLLRLLQERISHRFRPRRQHFNPPYIFEPKEAAKQ